MPYKEGQPTLIDYLGTEPVTRLAKTRLLGGRYLRYYDYCSILAFVYESGAVIGRARHNKLSILEKILEAPWKGPEFMKFCQDQAKERLDAFRSEARREPHSFLEFILIEELAKAIKDKELRQQLKGVMTKMRDTLLQKGGAGEREIGLLKEVSAPVSEKGEIAKALQKKVRLRTVEWVIRFFGQEGIGFGSSFPELTERMYRNLHENPILEKSSIISLEEGEETVLQIVAVYVSQYYPELLDPLDLRDYLAALGDLLK